MSKYNSIKMLILSSFSIIYTSFAAAGIQSGSWPLAGDVGSSVVGAGNAVIWYEISTVPELAFFVAIWVATAAITLKFIDMIWDVVTQRVNLGSSDRYSIGNGDNETGNLEKIVAVALSFIGAQYIGGIIGPLLAGTMLLLGSMILIAVILIFYYFLIAGNGERNAENPQTDGVSSDHLEGQLNRAKDELRDEIQKSQTVEQKLNGLKHSNFEEAAQRFMNDDRLPQELRREIREMAEGFEDEEDKEMTLLDVLEDIEKREESQLKEEYEIAEMHSWVNNEINHILQEERRFKEMSNQMEEKFEELSNEQDTLIERLDEAESQGNVEAIEQLRKQLEMNKEEFKNLLQKSDEARQKLAEELTSELGDVDSRLDQMESELGDVKSKQSKTDDELGQAEKEDKVMMKEADNVKNLFKQLERDMPEGAKDSSTNNELMKDLEWMADAANAEDSILDEAEDLEGREEQVGATEKAADKQDRKQEQEAVRQADNLEQLFERFENTVSERIEKANQAGKQSGQAEAEEVQREKKLDQELEEVVNELRKIDQESTNLSNERIIGKAGKELDLMRQIVQELPAPQKTPPEQRQEVERMQGEAYQIMADLYETIEQRGGDGASKYLDQMKSFQKRFPLYGELRR